MDKKTEGLVSVNEKKKINSELWFIYIFNHQRGVKLWFFDSTNNIQLYRIINYIELYRILGKEW